LDDPTAALAAGKAHGLVLGAFLAREEGWTFLLQSDENPTIFSLTVAVGVKQPGSLPGSDPRPQGEGVLL
jgi:hypothetical protein